MVSITLDGNNYDHIIDVAFVEVKTVSLPEWINDATPDIDTSVWSKKPLGIIYTLRVTDGEKWTLDQILQNHQQINLTDTTYSFTDAQVWMIELEAEWEGDINWSNPWKVTLELIYITGGESIEEITSEISQATASGTLTASWIHPMVVTEDGTIHIVFDDDDDTVHMFSRNGGETWSGPTIVSSMNGHAGIDKDSNGNLYVVITNKSSYPDSNIYFVKGTVSKNGDWTWNWGTTSIIETGDSAYPTILIDSINTIHVGCTYTLDVGWKYMYSTNGGSSWTKHNFNWSANSYPNLLEDASNNIHIIVSKFIGGIYYLKVTYSGGINYSVGSASLIGSGYYATASIDKTNGIIYIMYNKPRGFQPSEMVRFYFIKSTSLNPISWSSEQILHGGKNCYHSSKQILVHTSSKIKAFLGIASFNEPWDSVTGWTQGGSGTSEISPAGQLHHVPNAESSIYRWKDIGSLPTDYTVEFRAKIDSFGTGDGSFSHEFYDGIHRVRFAIYANRIYNNDSDTTIYVATDNDWHTWRLVIDSDGHSLKVYKDGSYLGDLGAGVDYTIADGTIYASNTINPVGASGCETHTDYLEIADELISPPNDLSGILYRDSEDYGENWSDETSLVDDNAENINPRGQPRQVSVFRIIYMKGTTIYFYGFGN